MMVAYPVLRHAAAGRVAFDLMLTLVFLATFVAVFRPRGFRLVTVAFGLPAVVGVWTGYVVPGLPVHATEMALHLTAAAFLAFAISVILRSIYMEQSVSKDGVYGAFCGYLLLGVTFGHVYCFIETSQPGSFVAAGNLEAQLADHAEQRFVLTYFSFLTLTTVGYGDVVPATGVTRSVAVVQAVTGQFYLAVLVAELIGRRVSEAIAERSRPRHEPAGKP
jgi:voltage-gated potassium channel Kch